MKLLTAVCILCVTQVQAQAPEPKPEPTEAKIVLDAPDTARVGELVRFDVSESTADSFKWLIAPDSDDFLTYDSGRRAVFSARVQGEYQFIVACAKDGTVDAVTHIVRVIGPPPQPTTPSLTEWIPFWAWPMNLSSTEAQALADNFEIIAERKLAEPEDWIKETANVNRETLGQSLSNWEPLLDKIGKALHKQAEEGSLTTPDQHVETWLEIAEGLRQI